MVHVDKAPSGAIAPSAAFDFIVCRRAIIIRPEQTGSVAKHRPSNSAAERKLKFSCLR